MRYVVGAGVCALLSLSCGGSDLLLPSEGEPAAMSIVAGDGQTGPVGARLPDSIAVRLTDSRDRPVVGERVVFTLGGGAAGGHVIPDTALTDADGRASAVWILGSQAGTQHVNARPSSGTVPLDAQFTATATSGSAAQLVIVSGNNQSGPAGTTLPDPLVVRVTDADGNPAAGTTVVWTVVGGGSADPAEGTSGADGRASTRRTLGPIPGTQATIVTAQGIAGSPVSFTHTATVGTSIRVVVASGNNQSAPVGSRLPNPLVVLVLDQNGNAVPGRTVNWVVGEGGGAVDPASSTTSASGQASTAFTLGPRAGANTVSAVVSGAASAVFTATGTAASAARLAIVTQPSSTASSGVPFAQQPVIQLQDAAGNAVAQAAVAVTAAIASGGGSLSGTATVSTNGAGRAAFADLAITGSPGPRTLIFAADGFASVTSSTIAVGVGPVSATRSSLSATPTTFTAGSGFSTITVVARDASGTAVPGATVVLSVSGDGNTVTQPTGPTDVSGTATGSFTSTAAGVKTVSATAGGVALSQTVTVTVEAAPPPPQPSVIQLVSGDQQTGTAGAPLPAPLVVRVLTTNGAPAPGVAVTWAVTSGGGALSGASTTTGSDGATSVTWTLGTAGEPQTATASAGGLSGSPVTFTATATAPAPDATRTSATVPNGTAGQPTNITVQSRDAAGQNLTTGGATVVVSVSGANTAGPIVATDNHDGTYAAAYTPIVAGTDQVAITLDGAAIGGSPYTSVVAPAAMTGLEFKPPPSDSPVDLRLSPVAVAMEGRFSTDDLA